MLVGFGSNWDRHLCDEPIPFGITGYDHFSKITGGSLDGRTATGFGFDKAIYEFNLRKWSDVYWKEWYWYNSSDNTLYYLKGEK
jgi:hypothetical protein